MFLVGVIYTVGVFAFASVPWHMTLWLVGAGVLTAVLVALSMRFYHFWLSWLIWAVPAPAVIGVAVAGPMSEGVIHPATAILIGAGIPLAVTFGCFWLLRKQLRGWLA